MQEGDPRRQHAAMHDRIVGVARHEQGFQVGTGLGELLGQVLAADARHNDVGQQQVDGAGMVPGD